MHAAAITSLFCEPDAADAARRYLAAEGLLPLILAPPGDPARIPPDLRDLARLHQALRGRRVFTVLEFGSGYSTLVMADALLKNKRDWAALQPKPRARHHNPFELHAVDTSPHWAAESRAMLPEHLAAVVAIHVSPAQAGTFQDRACHYYTTLPDIVPDFIYLDGPDPAAVEGAVGGLTWQNPDRCVLAGDILRMEPHLLPGTLVLVDGRRANALFLAGQFYRRWDVQYDAGSDVTALELQDPPLGAINRATLAYCLGERALAW